MSGLKDQTRNLNPTPQALIASIIWGQEYSQQRGGCMDFWDRLSADRKQRCNIAAEKLTGTLRVVVKEKKYEEIVDHVRVLVAIDALLPTHDENLREILGQLSLWRFEFEQAQRRAQEEADKA